MRLKFILIIIIGVILICLIMGGLFTLPSVRSQVVWHVENQITRFKRIINPPEKIVFQPEEQTQPNTVEAVVNATLAYLSPSSSLTLFDITTLTAEIAVSTPTPTTQLIPSATPSATTLPTDIPEKVILTGITHEYQNFNNCGPANLSMALSYWGWQGDQTITRAFLRPNLEIDDKNVMPEEMVQFVETQTHLKAISLVGGTNLRVKELIAAGFPVLIEAGHHPADDWWMGHYVVISGYDDQEQVFISQDSLISPDLPIPYDELEQKWWRDFNRIYIVIYPPEREADLFKIIGEDHDPLTNYQQAAQRTQEEIRLLQGRDLFFAYFNLGTNLVGLEDYPSAAQAYDQAFNIYQSLSEDMRPYRMMWYQTGPYQAYYHTGRYQDVINLANTTFTWVGKFTLEESFYWRGLAYAALGNMSQAQSDLSKAVQLNPNYAAALEALQNLGISAP
jgi:hypothetical protein